MSLKGDHISDGASRMKDLIPWCMEGSAEGTCMDAEQCFLLSGQVGQPCDAHRARWANRVMPTVFAVLVSIRYHGAWREVQKGLVWMQNSVSCCQARWANRVMPTVFAVLVSIRYHGAWREVQKGLVWMQNSVSCCQARWANRVMPTVFAVLARWANRVMPTVFAVLVSIRYHMVHGGKCRRYLYGCRTVFLVVRPAILSCGEGSSLSFSYFKSPTYPQESSGSLACDYDVFVHPHTCAIRIDFESASLAGKLGGTCDIDQLFILNSIDGPTSGLCGQLSGYSTTVAVSPSQLKPLKLAFLIQNEIQYHWYIKITQIPCELVTPYEAATKKQIMQKKPINRNSSYNVRRIINGFDTRAGEFPWVAAIGLDGLFFCGGALINNLFVLTAAHCLLMRDTPTESLTVHIGDYDLTLENETQHVVRKVEQVIFHSHFHPFLLANDIALLRLNSPVPYSIFVQPVCLPSEDEDLTWKGGTTVGWGFTSFSEGRPSPALLKLQVETISNAECSRLIEEPVSPGMICAASQPLQGTCFGDSGGPLTVTNHEGVSTVIGLVSFGISGCAMVPGLPDLYTRVSEYLPWISINLL
ncbi:ovochymase-1-like [Macrosteles quadrilineatus]|uniref:ovochymase-1-like n=1 Tax=Macrosteles quadrilineatus TaxID=74068 RepID=UPI0023E332DD|nr:ovochymase-1-like [Macrosteles quadrilineatus]